MENSICVRGVFLFISQYDSYASCPLILGRVIPEGAKRAGGDVL